jgi:hypothetical protein
VIFAGRTYALFDVGGAIGIAGLLFAAVWSVVRHGAFLYNEERL